MRFTAEFSCLFVLTLVLFVFGCTPAPPVVEHPSAVASDTLLGESGELYEGEVSSWAKLSTEGSITEVGLSASMDVFRHASEFGENDGDQLTGYHTYEGQENSVRLSLPKKVVDSTVFHHVQLDYNPEGHPPPPYQIPHFDIHAYTITEEEQDAIDCTDTTPVPNALLPEGWQLPPPPAWKQSCVPKMGLHAGSGPPKPLSTTLVLGYYAGKINFLEPMVANKVLLSKENFSFNVPPLSMGKATPTKFDARYDEKLDAYHFVWSNFVEA